ncbi:unnamed protein product, partial [Allacma fusca]
MTTPEVPQEIVVVRKVSRGNGSFPNNGESGRGRSDNIVFGYRDDLRMLPTSSSNFSSSAAAAAAAAAATTSSSSRTPHETNTYLEDEFSVDLPSDLPSGYVDIEANLVGTIRLGQEGDEDEEMMMLTKDHEFSGDFERNLPTHRRQPLNSLS